MKKRWTPTRQQLLKLLFTVGIVLTGIVMNYTSVQAAGTQVVYRLYNDANAEHLYTTDANEVVVLATQWGWTYEGSAWEAPTEGIPVYRLNNEALQNHLYTTDLHEIDVLTNGGYGWTMDNNGAPLFYSGDPETMDGLIPVYRLYNEGIRGMHLLTTDLNEYGVLATQGWEQEDVALYCMTLGSSEYPAPGDITPIPQPDPRAAKWDISYNSNGGVYSIYEYDKDWNNLKYTRYDSKDDLAEYTVYEYDENNWRIGYTDYDKDNKVISSFKEIYENGSYIGGNYYGANGELKHYYRIEDGENCSKYFYYSADGTLRYYYLYESDPNGAWEKSTYYDSKGKAGDWSITEYDPTAESEYRWCPLKRTSYRRDNTVREVEVYKPQSWNYLSDTYYKEDGVTIDYRDVYEYNEKGKIAKQFYESYDENGTAKVGWTYLYEYNEKDQRTKYTYIGSDGQVGWYDTYEYDERGNQTKINYYNGSNELTQVEVNEYDDDRRLVKSTRSDAANRVQSQVVYAFNSNGNRTKAEYYGVDAVLNYYYTYEYAENGRPMQWTKFNANGEAEKVTKY